MNHGQQYFETLEAYHIGLISETELREYSVEIFSKLLDNYGGTQ